MILYRVKSIGHIKLFVMSATFSPTMKYDLETFLNQEVTAVTGKCIFFIFCNNLLICFVLVKNTIRKYAIDIIDFGALISAISLDERQLNLLAVKTKQDLLRVPAAEKHFLDDGEAVSRHASITMAVEVVRKIVEAEIAGNILIFVNGMTDMNKIFNDKFIRQLAQQRLINYHRLHSQIDWDYNAEIDTAIRKVVSGFDWLNFN